MRRVAINGLGRIGRLALRQLTATPGVQVVAVNDLADPATLAHLLKYDTVHGRMDAEVVAEDGHLLIDGRRIRAWAEPDPGAIPFGTLGVELVLECTGAFTQREDAIRHLRDGVRHVLISESSPSADRTIVLGLNEADLDPAKDAVISCGGSAAAALAPLVKVLDDAFGLEHGFVTAVQSYTNDQRILDLPHGDLRLMRAAAMNMIPTATPAPHDLGRALPHLEGRLAGQAVRVPTPDMSIIDLTATLRTEATLPGIHEAFRAASRRGSLAPYLEVLEAELVSADLVGETASCLYDPFLTKVLGPRLVKVFGWHDNEWGYAARLKDLCLRVLEGGRP